MVFDELFAEPARSLFLRAVSSRPATAVNASKALASSDWEFSNPHSNCLHSNCLNSNPHSIQLPRPPIWAKTDARKPDKRPEHPCACRAPSVSRHILDSESDSRTFRFLFVYCSMFEVNFWGHNFRFARSSPAQFPTLNPKMKKLIANGPIITITVAAITNTPGKSIFTPASAAIASAR